MCAVEVWFHVCEIRRMFGFTANGTDSMCAASAVTVSSPAHHSCKPIRVHQVCEQHRLTCGSAGTSTHTRSSGFAFSTVSLSLFHLHVSSFPCLFSLLSFPFHTAAASPFAFTKCANIIACPGGSAGTCPSAYTGTRCSRCASGYYRAAQGVCEKCGFGGGVWKLPVMIILFVGVTSFIWLSLSTTSQASSKRVDVQVFTGINMVKVLF